MKGFESRRGAWEGSPDDAVVLAVDGGGSKTDVAAVTLGGDLIGTAHGAGSNPQLFGIEASLSTIDHLIRQVIAGIGDRTLLHTGIYLSGLDFPEELRAFSSAISETSWSLGTTGMPAHVENDLHALLRTGTGQPDAVVVICGSGINAMGARADGATVRFPALGMISGDWGGGTFLGEQAVWHAARSEDGRGPHTLLQELVPEFFGLDTVAKVSAALHFGRLKESDLTRLAPLLFTAADSGDAIAHSVVTRQAGEIVALIVAVLTRLDMLDREVPVILGGGVLAARHPKLIEPILSELHERADHAQIHVLDKRPIVGAALLCLEAVDADSAAISRAAKALS
ncbi:MAG: BadF/BadG/BcrA/BcrD ATPase family protein [Terrimesophilobacter sp.]